MRQSPFHLEFCGNRREVLTEVGEVNVEIFGIELHAHQEESGLFVGMFVGVQDVAVVAEDEVGNGRDFALCVGATNQENCAILHAVTVEQSSC